MQAQRSFQLTSNPSWLPNGLDTSSSSAPSPSEEMDRVHPQVLQEMITMGFDRALSHKALTRSRNNKAVAIEYLLSRQNDDASNNNVSTSTSRTNDTKIDLLDLPSIKSCGEENQGQKVAWS